MEYEYELYHHGVKGMKWGVRKARKAIGRSFKRFSKKTKKVISDKIAADKAKKEAQKKASRGIKELTDSELKDRAARLRLEKDVLDLERQVSSLSPQKVSAGQKFAKDIGGKLVSSLGNAATKVAGEYLESALKESLGLNKKDSNPFKDLEDSVKKLELQSREASAKRNIATAEDFFEKRKKKSGS